MDSPQTTQNGVKTSESRKLQRSDEQFISDVNAAVLMGASRSSHLILAATALFLVVALLWAANATLDEVTRGEGKVIPSSKVQVVQNLEGGILDRILVSEGDLVERDQPLLQLDDTRFSSTFRETRLKYLALLAKSARLEAEANNQPLQIPDVVRQEREAQQLANLTGWDIGSIRDKIAFAGGQRPDSEREPWWKRLWQ